MAGGYPDSTEIVEPPPRKTDEGRRQKVEGGMKKEECRKTTDYEPVTSDQ